MSKCKFLIFINLSLVLIALYWGVDQGSAYVLGSSGYYVPDYFATPNWANSPPLTIASCGGQMTCVVI